MLRVGPVVVGGTTTSGGVVKTSILKILTWMGLVKEPIQIADVVSTAVAVSEVVVSAIPDEIELVGQHPAMVALKLLFSRYGVMVACSVVQMALPFRTARVLAQLSGPLRGVMYVECETRFTAGLRCGAALLGLVAANWSKALLGPEGVANQHCAVLDGLQVADELASYYHGNYHEEVSEVRKIVPRVYQAYGLLSIAHSLKMLVEAGIQRDAGVVMRLARGALGLGTLVYKLWNNWSWVGHTQSEEHEAIEQNAALYNDHYFGNAQMMPVNGLFYARVKVEKHTRTRKVADELSRDQAHDDALDQTIGVAPGPVNEQHAHTNNARKNQQENVEERGLEEEREDVTLMEHQNLIDLAATHGLAVPTMGVLKRMPKDAVGIDALFAGGPRDMRNACVSAGKIKFMQTPSLSRANVAIVASWVAEWIPRNIALQTMRLHDQRVLFIQCVTLLMMPSPEEVVRFRGLKSPAMQRFIKRAALEWAD